MAAYTPDSWHELFLMVGGASAALAGLIFVAVSLNQEPILKTPSLPALALRTLTILIGIVALCIAGLVPDQGQLALGVEILLVGVVMAAVALGTTIRNFAPTTFLRRRIGLVALAAAASLPAVVAGVSIIVGAGGGLYWLAVEFAAGISVATYHAWILLIVIRRES